MNGTQLAAVCNDDTVIAWSYPSGEILFPIKRHEILGNEIKWNPFTQDVFAAFLQIRNAVNSLIYSYVRIFLFGGGRKVAFI